MEKRVKQNEKHARDGKDKEISSCLLTVCKFFTLISLANVSDCSCP